MSSKQPSIEQRRRAVIALLDQQLSINEVAAQTRYSPRWVREIAKRYRALGAESLRDQRQGAGAAPLLSVALQQALQAALQTPPPEGGCWTGPKVARWIAAHTGQQVHRQRGWEYLRRLALPDDHIRANGVQSDNSDPAP
jgi:transposase